MKKKGKKKIGRPPKYSKPKDMQGIIDNYFTTQLEAEEPLTVTGLALALNMSRQALVDYEKKDEFLDTIKKAKLRIEEFLEKRLFGSQVAGVIFNLKNNYNWKDAQQLDATIKSAPGVDLIPIGEFLKIKKDG